MVISMKREMVSKSEFKAKALELLREVEAGSEPLIVTDRGKPSIEVRCYRPTERAPLDILKGSVKEYVSPLEPVGETGWEALE